MTTVWCEVPRDVVAVRGHDAETYLQGQCSQDVTKIDAGASAWSFVLQPPGKVDVLCRIHRVNDRTFVLDTDAGWGQALLDRLLRFKLRVKVDLDRVAWRMIAVRGPAAPAAGPGGAGQLVGRAGRRRPPRGGRGAAAGGRGRGRRRPRAPAGRSGVAGHGVRAHHRHDPGRGRRGADRRELHQGLLHGPGAGGPHRQPGRQRAPPSAPSAPARHRSPWRPATASHATARTWVGSRAWPATSPSATWPAASSRRPRCCSPVPRCGVETITP